MILPGLTQKKSTGCVAFSIRRYVGRDARIRKQRQRHGMHSVAPQPIVNVREQTVLRDALQPKRKTGVFVAIPTLTGDVNFTIALLFARLMGSNAAPDCPFHFIPHIEPGKRGIDYARNSIVRTFMEQSDADWLYMIDHDQIVPEDFWHLCMVKDADVVSAVCPVWVNTHAETALRYNAYDLDDKHRCINLPIPPDDLKQPMRVPIVGTGAIAIRRRVFAPKPHGVGLNPFYFTYEDNRKVQAGEDVNFSVEAQRAGFVVAVHPGVRFDHMKSLPLWQIKDYYDARKKMEDAGAQPTLEQRLSIG